MLSWIQAASLHWIIRFSPRANKAPGTTRKLDIEKNSRARPEHSRFFLGILRHVSPPPSRLRRISQSSEILQIQPCGAGGLWVTPGSSVQHTISAVNASEANIFSVLAEVGACRVFGSPLCTVYLWLGCCLTHDAEPFLQPFCAYNITKWRRKQTLFFMVCFLGTSASRLATFLVLLYVTVIGSSVLCNIRSGSC